MPNQKLHLALFHKMALPGANRIDRVLLGAGHVALALNASTVVFGAMPIGGVLSAAILFTAVYMRRNPFARDAAKQGYMRTLFALFLVIVFTDLSRSGSITDYWYNWLLLFMIQTPISAYDAWRAAKGHMGLRLLPIKKQNILK